MGSKKYSPRNWKRFGVEDFQNYYGENYQGMSQLEVKEADRGFYNQVLKRGLLIQVFQTALSKEYFYTNEFFRPVDNSILLEHITQYLEGERDIPIFKTGGVNDHDVSFTFSDNLLERFIEKPNSIKKPYEVALKYGFRGYSSGGKNGIFLLREGDDPLVEAINNIYNNNTVEGLNIQDYSIDNCRGVKIVWHQPLGERIVGLYNTKESKILFLDFAKY